MRVNIILLAIAIMLMGFGTTISGCEMAGKMKDRVSNTLNKI